MKPILINQDLMKRTRILVCYLFSLFSPIAHAQPSAPVVRDRAPHLHDRSPHIHPHGVQAS